MQDIQNEEQFTPTEGNRAVCILGMHRSGTSAVARVLNLLGVYLGKEENIMPPGPDNPEGFWENTKIVEIHDRLLQTLGYGWDTTLPLPHEWWRFPEVKPFKEELKKLVTEEFSDCKLWGWKDPRTCILLPFWIELLKELKVDLSFVIVTRNPLEVADSLTRRNGFSAEKGWAMWFLYMVNALYWSQSYKRTLISYEDFMQDWKQEIRRAITELSIPWPEDEENFTGQVGKFIKPQLRHHSRSVNEAFALLPKPIAELYELCLEKDEIESAANSAKVNQLFTVYETISQIGVFEHKLQFVTEQLDRELTNLQAVVEQKERQLQDVFVQLETIQSSLPFKLLARYNRWRERLLPEGTRRYRLYRLLIKAAHVALDEGLWTMFSRAWQYARNRCLKTTVASESHDQRYKLWIKKNEPKCCKLLKYKVLTMKTKPKITIMSFTPKLDRKATEDLVKSLKAQVYSNWELCLLLPYSHPNDGSSRLGSILRRERRVKIKNLDEQNEGQISKELQGDFVGILGTDHTLAPFALYEVVKAINEDSSIDVIYSDEDTISQDLKHRSEPRFKPDWSPDTLRSYNYIGEFLIIRKRLFDEIINDVKMSDLNSAELYDLTLCATEKANRVLHIPKVLHHQIEKSSSEPLSILPSIPEEKEAYRKKLTSDVCLTDATEVNVSGVGFKFSIVILTKDKPEYIIPLLKSLQTDDLGRYYEVIVGDTGTSNREVIEFYKTIDTKITIVKGLRYHFSKNYNFLVANYARGEIIGIWNNDIVLPNVSFLNQIEEIFRNPKVGIVGTKLLYPNGTLQHGGVFFKEKGDHVGLPYHRLHGGNPQKLPDVEFEAVPAVTGAFMFCRKKDYLYLCGFDESYQEEAQDIDLCLKIRRTGQEVVFANIDNIIHIENATRGKGSENWDDRHYFIWKWKSFMEATIFKTELNKERLKY